MSDNDFEIMEKEADTQEQTEESGGLGMGLNALFGEEDALAPAEESQEQTQAPAPAAPQPPAANPVEESFVAGSENLSGKRTSLPIEKIYRGRFQPRLVFEDEPLNQLAESIKQYGILQPLLVRADPDSPDVYEIIAGERRWQAAQRAQLHEVPVIILDMDEFEGFKVAMIENLQREDLDPIEEAEGYQTLLDRFDQTHDDLAKTMGKSRPHIGNMLRLLSLPPKVQTYLQHGDISMGHARALINVPNGEELVQDIIKKGLSVRQTEKLVAGEKKTSGTARPRAGSPAAETKPVNKDADTTALENDISNALGMRVTIDSADGRSGKLAVEFKSLDQLDEVLHRLAHFPGSRLKG